MMMMMMMVMMIMMMLMMDDYYLVFVVTSEYHFRILRQESISNALQQSGGLKQLWAFTGQPHQSRGNSSAALSTTRHITKITTVIYYSPPSAAGSTPSLSRVPLRSLSSAIAPSPTPLPRNPSFPTTFPLHIHKSTTTSTLPLMPRTHWLLYHIYRNN